MIASRIPVTTLLVAMQTVAMADVRLPALFGHNMALQQEAPIPVWGTASPGEKISVTLADKTVSVEAGKDGRWKLSLPPLPAGESLTLTVKGTNTVAFTNIVVGEVWVCSGQSNMRWPVRDALEPQKEIETAIWPKIRLFTVAITVAESPKEDVIGKWVECSPQSVGGFSAAGYFFGRELHQKLGRPVGLIHSSVGGTPAQAWTRLGCLEADPEFKKLVEHWNERKKGMEQARAKHEERVAEWKVAVQKAKEKGEKPPLRPRFVDPITSPTRPANLYNGMIAPLMPFAIRGVAWYQGEANANNPELYTRLFPAMIQDWRDQWGQGAFPFLFVQLANHTERFDHPTDPPWARLREAQLKALSVTNTGMAVAIDIGSDKSIHPRNKQDVGRRLAAWALHFVYGKKEVVPSGPIFDTMKIEGDKARLSFKFLGGGLVNKAEGGLKGFAIAGDDRNFVWADAKIDAETILVSSEKVKKPAAVRYGWAANPEVSLYNKAGLPASPFRTDDWPSATPASSK
jgi:sialate O-acetylesterase